VFQKILTEVRGSAEKKLVETLLRPGKVTKEDLDTGVRAISSL